MANRWPDVAAALGVAVALLAPGCLGGVQDSGSPAAVTILTPAPGVFLSSDKAALQGRVLNDASLPLKGIHVSLLGTERFQTSDEKGSYLFVNVTAGRYTLEASGSGLQTNDTEVTLTPGNLSTVDIYLLPTATGGAGYAPHLHDYWAGKETYTLMDHDQDFRRSQAPEVRYANVNDTPSSSSFQYRIQLPPSEPGHPSIILPGTKEIRITLSWTSASSTLSKMGVRYSPPGVSPLSPFATAVRESGKTVSIGVTPELADTGHQVFTYWVLYLCPCNDPRNAPNYQPGAILGPIHIQIVLIKGNVELELGHPDFWKGRDEILLLPGEWKTPSYVNVNDRTTSGCMGMATGTLVPPGTTRARFELRWRYAQANNTVLDSPYVLTWRTGDQDPAGTSFSEFRRAKGDSGDHRIVYDLEVPAPQTDSFYQKRSNWCWLPSVSGHEDEATTNDVGRGLQVWLRVEVARTG